MITKKLQKRTKPKYRLTNNIETVELYVSYLQRLIGVAIWRTLWAYQLQFHGNECFVIHGGRYRQEEGASVRPDLWGRRHGNLLSHQTLIANAGVNCLMMKRSIIKVLEFWFWLACL